MGVTSMLRSHTSVDLPVFISMAHGANGNPKLFLFLFNPLIQLSLKDVLGSFTPATAGSIALLVTILIRET